MEKVMLTPKEGIFPEVHTLDSKMLEAYKESIKSYKGRASKSLNILEDINGDLAGSNCFAPIKLREILPRGTRFATMADLGRATEINPNFLKKFHLDTGLVLRKVKDSYYTKNGFLAKDLAKQLKKRKIILKSPKIIYFDALDLREDENSAYGLAYNLNEKAKFEENIIDAPELISDSTDYFRFKSMNERGIPIIDKDGDRILFIREDGLSRFFLYKYFTVNSSTPNLAEFARDVGRVVVVTDKALKLEG